MVNLSKIIKRRVAFLFIVFIILLLSMIVRTGYLQIVQGEWLQKEAINQQTQDRIVRAKRGAVLDRNGETLAVSASAEHVTVFPNVIREEKNAEEIVEALSSILGLDREEVRKKVTADANYVSIKKQVEKSVADEIRKLDLRGVKLDEDSKRFYPFGNFASHIIGFTGDDNQGLNGIEKVFDEDLKGVPGRIVSASNARGTDVPYRFEQYIDPKDGNNVVLAIDETIQHFVEKYLEKALVECDLKEGAAAIVMNPRTGEILAMTSKPDFDLNQPFALNDKSLEEEIASLSGDERVKAKSDALNAMWRNKAVTDTYEPGSTFKLATSSIALEEGVINLNSTFYCGGSYTVEDRNIKCWDIAHGGHGTQTFVKAICNSCNPAFMQIGEKIGNAAYYKYMKAFGFRDITGIELPGEANGIFFSESTFKAVELATTSFGQGFQITPLQMISFVSAIGNGGMLYVPHLVRQITDNEGNVIRNIEPQPIRRIMSEQTAETMRNVMETVVTDGGGANAYIKGYRVGGKTGTSEKLPRGSGKYVASFIGMAPVDNPQLVVLIMLDEPTGLYYGGTIAAPVGRSIIADTLNYLGIEPQYTGSEVAEEEVLLPDVTDTGVQSAKNEMYSKGINYKVIGDGDTVLRQIPIAHAVVPKGSTVVLYTSENGDEMVEVPDLIGRTPSEVRYILTDAGLNYNFSDIVPGSSGAINAISQSPLPGARAYAGSVVSVDFRQITVD